MPTALDVEVDDAITPPPKISKKKSSASKKSNSEASKITPVPSTTKKKAQQQTAQQPSIMSFFNPGNAVEQKSKQESAAKPTLQEETNDDSTTDAAAPSPSKSAMPSATTTKVPTAQELRDIVLGGTKNLDNVVVPEPMPEGAAIAEDGLLPIVHMPSPPSEFQTSKRAPPPPSPMRDTDAMNNQEETITEKSLDDAAPNDKDSNVALTAGEEHSETKTEGDAKSAPPLNETSNKEESEVEDVSEKENKQVETEDEGDDDETVDMSPVKQNVANNDEKEVPQENTATESNKDASDKNPQVESGAADEAMNCVDLTQENAPTAAASSADNDATEPPTAKKSPAKSPKKPDADDVKPAAVPAGISSERKEALVKNGTLRAQYQSRLDGLIQRAHDGIAEESYTLPALEAVESLPEEGTTVSSPSEFPDCAIPSLALLVQDSRLPLSDLAATALIQLKDAYPDEVEFHEEGIAAKIKLLATREPYVQVDNTRVANAFQDENADRMWRWEIVSLELLPNDIVSKIKKARTARKKLRAHSKALCLLLKYLDQANKFLLDSKSTQAKCDDIETKISNAEQKVLKYEREEEKVRLAAETKRQKEAAKKQDGKQKGKSSAASDQKKREKELKKQAAAKEREDKKREKEAKKQEREAKKRKKEEEKQKEELEKAKKIKKQRTMMNSFFIHGKPKASKPKDSKPAAAKSTASVNSDDFWSRLNKSDTHVEGPMFPSLSAKAVASRKRRTRVVPVQVFATVMPANPFDTQPYAELQTIHVPNKYKFLRFCEDMRPPYHGTWSKTSSVVTGRNPVAKDTSCLDYEVDSEAEWEEGDDEIGEDCEADGPDEEDNVEDEEGDTRMYNYEDGWLAADDDLGIDDDDVDEDTKLLREKKKKAQQKVVADQATICIIAPGKGGIPSDDIPDKLEDASGRIEGVNPSAARDLLIQHTSQVLSSEGFCLDAFPPPLVEEGNLDASSPSGKSNKAATSDEMPRANLITFVEFVHHCEFGSIERVLSELMMAHPTVTSSRAQAGRKLDCLAVKKKYPGGVYWEIRRETLEELGLEELMKKEFVLPPPKPSSGKKPKSSAASSSAKSAAPGSATATKKKKASPKSAKATPDAAKPKSASSNEKSSAKKRPAQDAPSKASADLFAKFLNKKAKKEE